MSRIGMTVVDADTQPYTRRTVFIEHPEDSDLLQQAAQLHQGHGKFLNGEGDAVRFDDLDFGLQCGLSTMLLNQRKNLLPDQPGRYALPPGFNVIMEWAREGEEEQYIPDSPIRDGDSLSFLSGEDPALLWFDAEGEVANAQIDALAAGDTALGKAYERLEWAHGDACGWRRCMPGVEGPRSSDKMRASQGEALLLDLEGAGKSAFRTSREPREGLKLEHWISKEWVRDQSRGTRAWALEQRRKRLQRAEEERFRRWQKRREESEERNVVFRENEIEAGIRQGRQEVLGMRDHEFLQLYEGLVGEEVLGMQDLEFWKLCKGPVCEEVLGMQETDEFQQLYEGPVCEEDADTPDSPWAEDDEVMFG